MHRHALQRRTAQAQDDAFLESLYASTRTEELRPWAWPETQVQAFLAQQSRAQSMGYRHQFGAEHDHIVQLDGEDIGRLFVAPVGPALCVVDIAVLPAWRNQGIGTQLLQQVLRTAAEQGRPVQLSVMRGNPAQRLYERLGFAVTAQDDLYLELAWSAAPDTTLEAWVAPLAPRASAPTTGSCHATH
jgi:ribosomal protein S18 acetylase RimI-like enzyme